MIVRVDVGVVPPRVEIHEGHDLTALEAVVSASAHTWIDHDLLAGAAGAAGADGAAFAAMIELAGRHGWVDETGRVRAHVTFAPAEPNNTDGEQR